MARKVTHRPESLTESPASIDRPIDRLDALLRRFSVSAQMFHSGPLCGITDFPKNGDFGQLHLVKGGTVELHHGGRQQQRITEPSVVFYPRPMRHRFITDKVSGAEMACANVAFNAGSINPIAQALPGIVVMPLSELDATPILEALFNEAFTQNCGRQHVVNRLFEVVIVLILRSLLNRAGVDSGLLAGMAHPQIAKAMIAIHTAPERAWTLEQLAAVAGMSRSQFASVFPERVGTTPIEYLARYRICVAQDMLRKGESLKIIAVQVGYGSTAALSRAFTAICGQSARKWLAAKG